MSSLTYPDIREYALPQKNVLVISCIDLRLTDNLLNFLHDDNLATGMTIMQLQAHLYALLHIPRIRNTSRKICLKLSASLHGSRLWMSTYR